LFFLRSEIATFNVWPQIIDPTKSTTFSINLPVVSGSEEKKGGQENFAGPRFVIAAMELSTSMRSDTSISLLAAEDFPLV